jgi:hypothetical protein
VPVPKKKIKTKKGNQVKKVGGQVPVSIKQVKPTQGLMN